MTADETLTQLVDLSRELGREERRLVILGEGNTSADGGDGTFWVKASGAELATIDASGFCRVRTESVLRGLEAASTREDIEGVLKDCRVDPDDGRMPSVEVFLHALCLTEGEARWVGHTHPDSVLSILCSEAGAEPFRRHIFPDEIVVCGREVAVVPYVDPGLTLARAIRDELRRFREAHGHGPKLLLMENHGPVALGQTAREALNISRMVDKWARILIGTRAWGGPRHLPDSEADRIDTRPDENYRRQQLEGE